MTQLDAPTNGWFAHEPTEVLPPGETLRETLEALGMGQKKLAQRTGLSIKHINQIVQGQSALTPETAIAFERVTGVKASLWNALESNYRDHVARERERVLLDAEKDWLKAMPLAALRKRGVIQATARRTGAQLQEVLAFFGVSSIDAWNASWATPSAAFLQSSAFSADTAAVAAWLRLGELAAANVRCEPYDRAALRSRLPQLRELVLGDPAEFWPELVRLCSEVGVAVVIEPEIPGARASGATRWLSANKAIVQLSNRGKRNDKFWFAFFHELGHVLLHGKKEVFVEDNIGSDGGRLAQEGEANAFAQNILVPRESLAELTRLTTAADVRSYAQRLGLPPGIVLGRLQRERDDYTYLAAEKLFEKFIVTEAED